MINYLEFIELLEKAKEIELKEFLIETLKHENLTNKELLNYRTKQLNIIYKLAKMNFNELIEGLNVRKIKKMLSLSESTVYKWKSGDNTPSGATYYTIAYIKFSKMLDEMEEKQNKKEVQEKYKELTLFIENYIKGYNNEEKL